MSIRSKIGWPVAIIAIVLLFWYGNRPEILRVDLVSVETGLTEATVANTRAGTITACQRSKLALSIGGQIDAIHVKEGDKVKQGQVLLQLWNKDLRAQLEAAKAALNAADYEKRSHCIQSASDKREATRQKNLYKQKLVSEEIRDMASTKAKASQAACTAAEARKQQAKAQLTLAQASLEKTFLKAPFDGTVAEVTGEVGEFSTPSPPGVATPPAVDLITTDCHYIKAPIDEVDAGEISEGMPVRISLDAYRGQTFQGILRRISPYVQDYAKQARTVEVEVEFANQKLPKLLAGYSVDIEIVLAKSEQGLRIPTDALMDDSKVLILNNQGLIEEVEVSIGLSNWQYSEITAGLSQGQQILVNLGDENIRAGVRAKAK